MAPFDNILDYLQTSATGIGGAMQGQLESFLNPTQQGGVASIGMVPPAPTVPVQPSAVDLATSFMMQKDVEGFSASPYSDYAQTSIGYGTKAQPGDKQIGKKEAEVRLRDHINAEVLPAIQTLVDPQVWASLPPRRKAALTSLIYNVGSGAFARSEALKALNSGDFARFEKEAFDPKKGFVNVTEKGKRKVSKGLQERRRKELNLWK